jgi:hypothetical protein
MTLRIADLKFKIRVNSKKEGAFCGDKQERSYRIQIKFLPLAFIREYCKSAFSGRQFRAKTVK